MAPRLNSQGAPTRLAEGLEWCSKGGILEAAPTEKEQESEDPRTSFPLPLLPAWTCVFPRSVRLEGG